MLRAAQISRSHTAALNLPLVTRRWQKSTGPSSTTSAKPTAAAAAGAVNTSTPTYKTTAPPLAPKTMPDFNTDHSSSKSTKASTNSYSNTVPPPGRLGSSSNRGSGGSGRAFKGLFFGLAFGLTGTIAYAEYEDGPFRQQLESNIPYCSTVLSSIDQYLDPVLGRQRPSKNPDAGNFPELGIVKDPAYKLDQPLKPIVEIKKETVTEKKTIQKVGEQVKDTVSQVPSKLPDTKKAKEKLEHAVDQAKDTINGVRENLPDSKTVKKNLETVKGKVEDAAHSVKDKLKESLPSTKVAQDKKPVEVNETKSPEPPVKDKAQQIEEELQRLIVPLAKQLDDAFKAAQEHVNHMKTIIDSSQIPNSEHELWKQAEQLQEKAKQAYEQVTNLFGDWKNKLNDYATVNNGKVYLDEKKIDEKFQEVQKEFTTSNFVRNFRTYIDEAARSFQKEIETMFPSLAGKNPAQLTAEDFQALLVHAHRRIVKLQNDIARMKIKEEDSVKAAIDVARIELDQIVEQQVQERVRKTTEQLTAELKYYEKNLREQFDDQLRHEIVLQHQALTQYLADVLARQYQEWTREYEKQLENESIKIHLSIQNELRSTFDRLHAIEHAIETNHTSQERARQAQQLWIQAQNLLHQIVQGTTTEADLENLGRIIPDEKFVQVLLNELKGEDLGQTNEELLRDRFRHVSKLCRRFALIDENHNSLLHYFLSYLQSLFIIEKRDRSILNDDAIDLNQLDTFKILNYVQTYLDHNQWYNALRLMQLLTGEPRNAAQSWINDTRTYLAKKQTSELLEAYSNSIGLGTLPRKA